MTSPRRHQKIAIKSAVKHFKNNTLGQMHMPCGSGKSLTGFWITEKLEVNTILVTVPSISLAAQTLEVYKREEPNTKYLVVCSDKTIQGRESEKKAAAELNLSVTTSWKKIFSWFSKVGKDEKAVVFSTYQSLNEVKQALGYSRSRKEKGRFNRVFKFDFAIVDEAHRTVGGFNTIHKIDCPKLFMTATPRDRRDGTGMNGALYGEVFYSLSHKQAVKDGIILPFDIVAMVISDEQVNKLLKSRKIKVDRKYVSSTAAAGIITLHKRMKKSHEPFKKGLTFSSTVKGAEELARLSNQLDSTVPVWTVTGKDSTKKKQKILSGFAKEQKAVLTNARCLGEGVDVPALNFGLFADPKQSTVDIVQAIGRLSRPAPGKKRAEIVIPVFFDKNGEIKNDRTKELKRVIAAVMTYDEALRAEYDEKGTIANLQVDEFERGSFKDDKGGLADDITLRELNKKITNFIFDICKPNGYWSYENCLNSARKFKNRSDWKKNESGAYDAAHRNGWLKKIAEQVWK